MISAKTLEKQDESGKKLLALLENGEKLFAGLQNEKTHEISALKQKVLNKNLHVVVLGSFKRGKSTFINALLGEKILPSYATPCTAVINEVKWGETKKAIVHFRSLDDMISLQKTALPSLPEKAREHLKRFPHGPVEPLEIQLDELEEYVVIKNPGEDSFESTHDLPYDYVEIFWPLPLLKNGIVVIDSPGLDECDTRTRITADYLSRADAILYVQSCSALAGQAEMDFIDSMLIGNAYEDTIFICNQFDKIKGKERDRVVTYGREKLGAKTNFGPEGGVFFLSAFNALEGRLGKDDRQVEESGIIEMEKRLYSMLVTSHVRTKLVQPTRFFVQELVKLTDDVYAKRSGVHEQVQDLHFRLKEFKRHLERELVTIHKTLERLLNDLLKIIQETKETIEYVFLNNLAPTIAQAIMDCQPKNTIGLSYFFSEANVRRDRILQIGKEIKNKIATFFKTNQKEMNQWLQSYIEERNAATEDFIAFAVDRIADSLHRLESVLEGESSADTSFDTTSVKVDKLPKLADAKTLWHSRQKQDILKTLRNCGIEGTKLHTRSLSTFFFVHTWDNDSYFRGVDESDMQRILVEMGFPYDDSTKDTGELKMAIGDFLYGRLIERKDSLIEPHTKGWDKEVTAFFDSFWLHIDERLDQIKSQAEKHGLALSAFQKSRSESDELLKELQGIRMSLNDLIYDLVVL